MGRGHAPGPQPRQGARQVAGCRRGDRPRRPHEHPRLAHIAAPLHDRRSPQRLQLVASEPALHRHGPLPPLDPLRGHRHRRRHHRHLGFGRHRCSRSVLDQGPRKSRPSFSPRASSSSRSMRRCRTPPSTRRATCRSRSRSRAGAARTSGPASPGSKSKAPGQASASISRTWNATATRTWNLSTPLLWCDWSVGTGLWRQPPPWGEHIRIND